MLIDLARSLTLVVLTCCRLRCNVLLYVTRPVSVLLLKDGSLIRNVRFHVSNRLKTAKLDLSSHRFTPKAKGGRRGSEHPQKGYSKPHRCCHMARNDRQHEHTY
jgi:hypothetical protein